MGIWPTNAIVSAGFRSNTGDPRDPGRVVGRFKEFDQILAGDRGGHGVDQRMGVDDGVFHQGSIQHHGDPSFLVVDGAESGDRAGRDAEKFTQKVGRAEGKAAAGTEQAMQAFQVAFGVFLGHHQINRLFLVAQEQIFGVACTAARFLRHPADLIQAANFTAAVAF